MWVGKGCGSPAVSFFELLLWVDFNEGCCCGSLGLSLNFSREGEEVLADGGVGGGRVSTVVTTVGRSTAGSLEACVGAVEAPVSGRSLAAGEATGSASRGSVA